MIKQNESGVDNDMITWVAIKQNESEVGGDMLMVSKVLFYFNNMQISMLKPDTCRKYMFHVT